eukprot:scaffold288_cov94-Phaeocystis_antarctica.AAC.1
MQAVLYTVYNWGRLLLPACYILYYSGGNSYTHSLSPSRPPNNTLNTQSRAQQTHSRSRSLRAHPHRADPPSVLRSLEEEGSPAVPPSPESCLRAV